MTQLVLFEDWDNEGAEGFSETVNEIQDILDPDMITYCFAAQ